MPTARIHVRAPKRRFLVQQIQAILRLGMSFCSGNASFTLGTHLSLWQNSANTQVVSLLDQSLESASYLTMTFLYRSFFTV
jgi:hypothetical protein